ncbi:hypothetical protein M3Y96_00320800 [Aphelenchoides besseyi]|nr:hypothetical protein M3Y96_00320800 [Aphelenchoides besseyi]
MIFGRVLGDFWKPRSKHGGGASMLFFVLLTAMFVAAESFDCLNEKTLEGPCTDLSVSVTSNSDTIKTTMEIKAESGEFRGSLTIGNCTITGKFSLGIQTFAPDGNTTDAFRSPITIEAKPTEVTFQSGSNPKKNLCRTSPFTLGPDGKAQTSIKLHVDRKDVVSLKLDGSVTVRDEHEQKENKLPTWSIILICVGVSVLAIAIVVGIGIWCCCCKKDDEHDDNLEDGGRKCCGLGKKSAPKFNVFDDYEWPCQSFTREQEDQLLKRFPVLILSDYEVQRRVKVFLEKHPFKDSRQLENLQSEYHRYSWYVSKNLTKSGRLKPTREYQMQQILHKILQCEDVTEGPTFEPQSTKKTKKKQTTTAVNKKEAPEKKKETPAEKKQ